VTPASPLVKTEDVEDNVPAVASGSTAQETPDAGRSAVAPSAPRLPALAFQASTATLSSHTPNLSSAGTPSRSTSAHRAVRRMSNSRDLHGQASTSAASMDVDSGDAAQQAGGEAVDEAMDDSVSVKEEEDPEA
jgi:hypothetical protein